MEWKVLKEQYREVLHSQMTTDPVKETIEVYQQLLKNGYDEDQAIDKMTVYLHEHIIETMRNNKHDESLWAQKNNTFKTRQY